MQKQYASPQHFAISVGPVDYHPDGNMLSSWSVICCHPSGTLSRLWFGGDVMGIRDSQMLSSRHLSTANKWVIEIGLDDIYASRAALPLQILNVSDKIRGFAYVPHCCPPLCCISFLMIFRHCWHDHGRLQEADVHPAPLSGHEPGPEVQQCVV